MILDVNYRSTKAILNASNALIANNIGRHSKQLRTENPGGAPINRYRANTEQDEARFVADRIEDLISRGISYSNISIFYRTNAQSRAIEEEFYARSIPHTIYGGQRFYDRAEIKDILGYCKLALNSVDNEAFLRVVNSPN